MMALWGFVFLGLFSPGPNVVLLTASGARFGLRRTLPHLLGVVLGVGIIAFVTGFGLGALLDAFPALRFALTALASLWILWLAWRLWHAQPADPQQKDRPFGFVEAILFQWINPKIWAVATSAMFYLEAGRPLTQAFTLAAAFSGTNLYVCLFWTYAGSLLSALLTDPAKWQIFMRAMALALVAFAGLVFL